MLRKTALVKTNFLICQDANCLFFFNHVLISSITYHVLRFKTKDFANHIIVVMKYIFPVNNGRRYKGAQCMPNSGKVTENAQHPVQRWSLEQLEQ